MRRWLVIAMVLIGFYLRPESEWAQGTGEQPPASIHVPAFPITSPAQSPETQNPLNSVTEFSAIAIGSMLGDDAEYHIYRSGKLMRTEMPDETSYAITDLSTFEVYGMAPEWCMHDTRPPVRAFPFTAVRGGATVERVAAGEEIVDGHPCHIEDIAITTPNATAPMKLRAWEASDLHGFPVKVEWKHPNRPSTFIQYKKVSVDPQDPTLFVHPSHCEAPPDKAPPKSPKAPSTNKTPSTTKPLVTSPQK